MAKATLLVLDGFGVGAMEDSPDSGANTCKHVGAQLPALHRMGLTAVTEGKPSKVAAYGRSALAHWGADTYMGHQELVGTIPKRPQQRLMKDVHQTIAAALTRAGYDVQYPWTGRPILLVEQFILVGDNLESAYGNIINVTADLQQISFEKVRSIGRCVRESVDVSRVIAFGGPNTSIERILSVVKENEPGQWGVDTPKSGVYGEGYEVYHMGYGVNMAGQFQSIAEKQQLPVFRIGKTADVLHGGGYANPVVDTSNVLQTLVEQYEKAHTDAAFLVNVQETDLAGHAEDVQWYRSVLETVDQWFESFLALMKPEDILIITADHGNDPTIGHSRHTREYTPILVIGEQISPVSIGTRTTMADIGATLAEYFQLQATESGRSFLGEMKKHSNNMG
ncbi:phosphopentomutase [Geomicrobium sp. JCM 19039]|uniref:phosphopentomutase n=1 Tax=Geomicrobium sp. JCM 19039 TaxID=1460636 RepID=UPI00045F2C6D|nr:phosphopentomutase [Geomicrobium sp. JCM 19039]GAK13230.1 phosphopentomutase [Geomicrobium sp. JCM 19039]